MNGLDLLFLRIKILRPELLESFEYNIREIAASFDRGSIPILSGRSSFDWTVQLLGKKKKEVLQELRMHSPSMCSWLPRCS